jgi:hypothetical protein
MPADIKHMVLADHANIRQLMDQIERATAADGVGGRDNLFEQLQNELERHLELMADVIQPALGNSHDGTGDADKRLLGALDDLARLDKLTADWAGQFDSFRNEVDTAFSRHTEMLSAVDEFRARQLARDYARAKIVLIRKGGYVGRRGLGRTAAIAGGVAAAGLAGILALTWWRSQSEEPVASGRRNEPRLDASAIEGQRETSIAAQ